MYMDIDLITRKWQTLASVWTDSCVFVETLMDRSLIRQRCFQQDLNAVCMFDKMWLWKSLSSSSSLAAWKALILKWLLPAYLPIN